jgi:hypothetical protein
VRCFLAFFHHPSSYASGQHLLTADFHPIPSAECLFVASLTTLFQWLTIKGLNEGVIRKWRVGKDVEGSGRVPIIRYYPILSMEGLRKTIKNLSQHSRSPSRDLNPGPAEYEARLLTTQPGRLVFRYIIHEHRDRTVCTLRVQAIGVCAMAQAVSHRPLTAEARVRVRVNPCGICGGQSGTGTGFSPSSSIFPC